MIEKLLEPFGLSLGKKISKESIIDVSERKVV